MLRYSHFLLNSGALTLEPRNENINLSKYSFSRIGIESTTSRVYSHTFVASATTGLKYSSYITLILVNVKYKYFRLEFKINLQNVTHIYYRLLEVKLLAI